ncbi:MAG: 3-deoxy-8-phosphooctulonate synthase [Phycisphaerales bacterium]|nr:MAG: 3-deoxy-8-phosphooctulonate synthase [Phycisphaerales bacterium]
MTRLCKAGSVSIGTGQPLAIIAGPCVLETKELGLEIARTVGEACDRLGLSYIFKASFDKANRSSITSPRGPGLERGVAWIHEIGIETKRPTTTDIHDPSQAEPIATSIDLLQIPAFLCRQTDLLAAAGAAASRHGRGVNVKKGQFLAPGDMRGPVKKLAEAGCSNVMCTERGTTFGYGRLVNDFLGVGDLIELKAEGGSPPVCFDATHSTQLPGGGSVGGGAEQTGGRPDRAPLLARAAVAAGVHAVFLECHPEPSKGMSDAATMLPLKDVPALLQDLAAIRKALPKAIV